MDEKSQKRLWCSFFDQWWKKDLTDWIKRDRNHPSIVIYSVGNETRGAIAKDLVAQCNLLDPTRPVTSGHSGSDFMNVLGVNGSSEKQGYLENLTDKQKGKVFIGTENTHTWQVRGFYRTKTWFRDGYPNKNQRPYELPDLTEEEVFTHDWVDELDRKNRKQIFNSSYDNATVRVSSRLNIEQLRDIPAYAGSFRWTGYDYIGEAGYVHGGWPFKAFMVEQLI
ncbi:glycoside hydrolase family 2 TIM barrel-domain containing protein [Algibacter lectus]|nr:glycoside hydrolase family 2 TIM barrel-domain containing protein [Algibacter lectus]